MLRPSSSTRPLPGGSSPVMTLNSVVLPAPFGPMSPVTQPSSTPTETLSSTRLPPNWTLMSSANRRVNAHPLQAEAAVEHVAVGGRERLVDAEELERDLLRRSLARDGLRDLGHEHEQRQRDHDEPPVADDVAPGEEVGQPFGRQPAQQHGLDPLHRLVAGHDVADHPARVLAQPDAEGG